jgi:D-sedoheptulose 7-phosphate isomerase
MSKSAVQTNGANFLTDYFDSYQRFLSDREVIPKLIEVADMMKTANQSGRKIVIAGNGGSASIASHCAVDFSKNAGIRCITFNDASLVTCLANDYGYEQWLQHALRIYADKGDLIVLISSSGKSPNILKAAEYARNNGYSLVTFTGFDSANPLRQLGHVNFWVDSHAYNIVEMTHHIWLLAMCDLVIGNSVYPAS